MSKSAKSKKNKVPAIGEKEYAEYIYFLKTAGSGDSRPQGRIDLVAMENSPSTKMKN